MKTIYSDEHRKHHGAGELLGNKLEPCFEKPERADRIVASVKAAGLGEIIAPLDYGRGPIAKVHDTGYLEFLEHAWREWEATGERGDALSFCSPMPDTGHHVPRSIHGRLAYYSSDTTTPITAGTWAAAYASAQVALTGQNLIASGERAVFSLCRPPGHHVARAYYGGYCYLNNAAIAAQKFKDSGASRVAILDVDYHHGNGTQSIFYDRDDVYFLSIHGDPNEEYPFFTGYADEVGRNKGEDFTANFPLPRGTGASSWFDALTECLRRIKNYEPDVLVVSLGVDTFEGDPISHFKLSKENFLPIGEKLASVAIPTLFVMEGGYAVEDIGVTVANVLVGYEGG